LNWINFTGEEKKVLRNQHTALEDDLRQRTMSSVRIIEEINSELKGVLDDRDYAMEAAHCYGRGGAEKAGDS